MLGQWCSGKRDYLSLQLAWFQSQSITFFLITPFDVFRDKVYPITPSIGWDSKCRHTAKLRFGSLVVGRQLELDAILRPSVRIPGE